MLWKSIRQLFVYFYRLPGPAFEFCFAHCSLLRPGKIFFVGPLVDLPDLVVFDFLTEADLGTDIPAGQPPGGEQRQLQGRPQAPPELQRPVDAPQSQR